MSKKEKRLYIFLAVFFILYVIVEQYKPEELVWIPTFSQKDKQPYGGYVLYERLDDFFESKELSFQTIYELRDSTYDNLMILATEFSPPEEDVEVLLQKIANGSSAFIGASYFSESFLDSLGLELDNEFFEPTTIGTVDSVKVRIGDEGAYYPSNLVLTAFEKDSSWVAAATSKKAILIYKNFGKGKLILTTLPLAFTNYGLLKSEGLKLPALALNLLSTGKVVYNRYYHSGRMESETPLRYLISQAPLRWALNLTLLGLIVLLIIGSRRKQRVIPVLDPKENTTLLFIKTMGGLYHREGKHASASQKLISHFLKSIREKYYIKDLFNEAAYAQLSSKTGIKKTEVIQTFEIIQHVKNGGMVSEDMLTELNQRIEKFNLK